jgi:hypothetical protein
MSRVHISVQLDEEQTQCSSFVVYDKTRARKVERNFSYVHYQWQILCFLTRLLFSGGHVWK